MSSDYNMFPEIYNFEKYRFNFCSTDEPRKYVHVSTTDGTAKFWLEPEIIPAEFYNLNVQELEEIEEMLKEKHSNS
jgi:hypothetical protein